jgi:hypothetical protein
MGKMARPAFVILLDLLSWPAGARTREPRQAVRTTFDGDSGGADMG